MKIYQSNQEKVQDDLKKLYDSNEDIAIKIY